jgi:filamentous hemagglutinin
MKSKSLLFAGTPVLLVGAFFCGSLTTDAGDLLRRGAASGGGASQADSAAGGATPASAVVARANALDALARTNQALDAVRAMQNAAQSVAAGGANNLGANPLNSAATLPNVPNGLGIGGLQVAPGVGTDPTKWTGADLPTSLDANGKTNVTIRQTAEQALLSWQTLNVGKTTQLTFDQSLGGADVAKWIAFNRIQDPTGNPTQILGSIQAQGQVYLINGNGVIFGGSSQVNARGLTVSSLPINSNLLRNGLLNNPSSQFLFSGLAAPGFVAETPVNARFGDVTVQAGARLTTVGDGGRILLAGPNVTNGGTITTRAGQTVLAAGLQVGVAAHEGADPSLRGLDVWIGKVGDAGNATNVGLIETLTGSALMAGRYVNQRGVIESSTSVNLNGRIDLLASYGAVSNPNYTAEGLDEGGKGPRFFNQFTGVVTLGEGSVTRILPDYLSAKTTPGSALPQRSQINIEGLAIHHERGSILLAPNAEVNERAGTWPIRDRNDNGSVADERLALSLFSDEIITGFALRRQKFLYEGGQIFMEPTASVNVAGSVDVFTALAQNILTVKLLGAELADSPLQRGTGLRGQALTVDLRDSGFFNGRFWIGTPLGDVTGLAGLIERNAAQLTAAGGNITLQAGGSVVVSAGAKLDVSGGFLNYEAGEVRTTSLISNGRLVAIRDATPDRVYDGIFTGQTTVTDAKWGVTNTYKIPLLGSRQEAAYVQGAAGGKLTITAPSMALDGELRGATVEGPRQQVSGTVLSKLTLNFEGEKFTPASSEISRFSPTALAVTFAKNAASRTVSSFSLASGDAPAALAADRLSSVVLTQKLLDEEGFGALEVVNPEGAITVAADAALKAIPRGSIALMAANVSIYGGIEASGGNLAFTAYNQSPTSILKADRQTLINPVAGRGIFTLGSAGKLSVAGRLVDDAIAGPSALRPRVVDGGAIRISAYSGSLARGSELDVAGGAYVSAARDVSYGKAGKISILTGIDPGNTDVLGGTLLLDSTLSGYSGAAGGTLDLIASRVQVGGVAQVGVLTLDENFFRRGGFTHYNVTGIGAKVAGTTDQYQPAVTLAAGAQISTAAESLRASFGSTGSTALERVLNVAGLRMPVNVSFNAVGANVLEAAPAGLDVRGDLRLETGSRFLAEPGATLSFKGDTVSLFGAVAAPGGSITVAGGSPLRRDRSFKDLARPAAFETVRLGAAAQLSTAGTVQLLPDPFGRRVGKVYDGGKISVSGNLIAENGSLLDVRGAAGTLDLDPLTLAQTTASSTPQIRGLLRAPQQFLNVATRIDSNGGQIRLAGGEILQSDATLLGAAGGSTAVGGSLAISSGRFINPSVVNSTADSNLTVVQSGLAPGGSSGGFFALDQFQNGGFDSLALNGGKDGNVNFSGKIDLNVRGGLDLAGGGVIRANDTVNITAGYLAVGQDFLKPAEVGGNIFTRTELGVADRADTFTPTAGSGNLNLSARFIDVGNLALLGIGNTQLTAVNGDIRGNGTLSVAGNLTLSAAQIYPTTLKKFDIFAYDSGAVKGAVTVNQNGSSQAPLSAAGNLGIYASRISQNGTLRAPLGTIRLGWDGVTGTAPFDPIAGLTSPAPVAERLDLTAGSVTSVSALGLQIPFGVSPDGSSWISPSGADITQSGLPEKEVVLAGETVNFAAGATVDLRGGGDVFASRFVAGNGGNRDLLGAGGQTGSAESFAIVPGYSAGYAPFGDFGTAGIGGIDFLAASPAYASAGLKVGDVITLDASSGLPAGTYTLLPRGYALLKGAFLVTPSSVLGNASVVTPEGASLVSGYRSNGLNPAAAVTTQRNRYELVSGVALAKRANYALLTADDFLGKMAVGSPLPKDAGRVAFQGRTGLMLEGSLLTQAAGRGAKADISSQADLYLRGGSRSTASGAGIALNTDLLNGWRVESLLVGGTRRRTATGTLVDVATGNLTLDNSGSPLVGNDIVLVSKGKLALAAGASLAASGSATNPAEFLSVNGDGALIRASRDGNAAISRNGASGVSGPELSLAIGSSISGTAVILDSSYGNFFSPQATVDAQALTLSSGQISVVFDGATGVVNPFLTLSGVTLAKLQQASVLKLQSASSIDFYGAGVLGGAATERLTLASGGLRGAEQGSGEVVLRGGEVRFENPQNTAAAAAGGASGRLKVDAERIVLGENATTVSGYQDVLLGARNEILTAGKGSFFTAGNLEALTAQLSGGTRSDYAIRAGQAVTLNRSSGVANASDVLGAQLLIEGASVAANSNILLPSGKLTLRATNGALDIGGSLSTAGTAKTFYDLTRYADAGEIVLESATGNVTLAAGGELSVAAAVSGGNAGSLKIKAAQGIFNNAGVLRGQAGSGGRGGDFSLDVSAVTASGGTSLDGIAAAASAGGFNHLQAYRVRNGDVAVAGTIQTQQFSLAADQGSIRLTGRIDASGETGGSIALAAHQDLVLASGAVLDASGRKFNTAGKGGAILLEAGTQRGGVANASGLLDLQAGSSIRLGVQDYVAGRYDAPGSSAFEGKFNGTLHLRAPRTVANNEVRVDAIESEILGASAVIVEGTKIYRPTNGVMNIALRNQINTDNTAFLGAAVTGNANETAITQRLLTGAANAAAWSSNLVLAPGVEIINTAGNLTLGLANPTGSNNPESRSTGDWDLSGFRYGSKGAAGVLTLRASGDLVFNNSLSDGFTPIVGNATNGNSNLWLARLATIQNALPTNAQSWSYRLTAGADVSASDFRSVQAAEVLAGSGSVKVGEFYPAVPNASSSGLQAGVGPAGQTADSIRISTDASTDKGTRYEVIRTGTGDITVSAGTDIQLRNQFASIYTAGVALPTPTTIYSANDFVLPVLPLSQHPSIPNAVATQQLTQAAWSLAGGNVALAAQQNIGRYTLVNGELTLDSTRELPSSWLYRRSYVDALTGRFSDDGGFGTNPALQIASDIHDKATSTTWWVDFSNFFQGAGALGGGNVSLTAGNDVVNVDAVTPTNARMVGRRANPNFSVGGSEPEFINVAADASKLLELGGGDVTVIAGRNIDGGVYYVERGKGSLFAGGAITTNAARSSELGILAPGGGLSTNPTSWLPTTLFVGKSSFDVTARGDVLLGQISNPFLLPQNTNNKFWYKTYFSTFAPEAGARVASYNGDVTHQSGGLRSWLDGFLSRSSQDRIIVADYQPWLRLALFGGIDPTINQLNAPNLRSTAFAGNLNLGAGFTLAPSARGSLELVAGKGIQGGNIVGSSGFGVATINLSDASPDLLPSITAPLAVQSILGAGRTSAATASNETNVLANVAAGLTETGQTRNRSPEQKRQLHGTALTHAGDPNPVRLYAVGQDISGVAMFSPKETKIIAQRDISDVAFYLQNNAATDTSIVSAGRDIRPYDENSSLRQQTSEPKTTALLGDIQINGPGVIEVLAGRTLDLGTGVNGADGVGVGLTSVGNLRNPNLPFIGADIIAQAGLTGPGGSGPALGLANSSIQLAAFIAKYINVDAEVTDSPYLTKIQLKKRFKDLTAEQQAIVATEKFFALLRETGRTAPRLGFQSGYAAVQAYYGTAKPAGDILTRSREIRTSSGGAITLGSSGGNITMASAITGNPLAPPGVVTEFGGGISTFTDQSVNIGQARIFTLRGGDITMWSSNGNIAAGTSSRTVVTAPPTRVVFDLFSANVQTDLGGLATGGGIGVLAAVEGVKAGNVDLIAPRGFVDAGDAGIRVTGNLNIAAQVVLNAGNISAGGTSTGASAAAVSAPSVAAVTTASNTSAAAGAAVTKPETTKPPEPAAVEAALSLISVEVIGYGGGDDEEEDKDQVSTQ